MESDYKYFATNIKTEVISACVKNAVRISFVNGDVLRVCVVNGSVNVLERMRRHPR